MRMTLFSASALALACLLTAAPASVRGASLDLGEALQEGTERSPGYRRAVAAASEKDWGRLEALSAFLPNVSLDGTRFFQDQYEVLPVAFGPLVGSFPEVNPYLQYGFDAHWTLFDGWNGINSLRAAELESEAAGLRRDWSLFQLKQDLRLKFYKALAARKLSKLDDENVKTLKDHLRIVEDLLANGRATRFDLLRVEVQLDDARTEQLAGQDAVAMARRGLAMAMGEDNDDRALSGTLPTPQAAPTDTIAADEKPDVKAKLLQADAARSAGLAAAGQWFPKVSLIGAYQWYDNGYNSSNSMDPSDTAAHGTSYDVGVEASWQIFKGGGDLARGMEASRRADEAVETAKEARLQAAYDRDLWTRRLDYSKQLYLTKLEEAGKAQESVRLATLGLKSGTRTTTEVLDAELDSFRAAAGVVSAQVDSAEALINLELALGTGDMP
jgi:outer membrane protein TolC